MNIRVANSCLSTLLVTYVHKPSLEARPQVGYHQIKYFPFSLFAKCNMPNTCTVATHTIEL